MKIEAVHKELQLNSIPNEQVIYSSDEKMFILVDDVKENRWKLTFNCMECFRVCTIELGAYNFNSKEFNQYRYIKNGCRYFLNYIFIVKDSEWLKQLKLKESYGASAFKELKDLKHFLIACEDYEIEVIAQDIDVSAVES